MRITVAIDSFKGSLSSLRAGEAVKEAALALDKENEVFVRPIADGGEGTVEALSVGMGGSLVTVRVAGPLFEPVDAVYAILPDGVTAVIEMAAAAGITLLPREKLNPLLTTTYGVGEMIKDAIARGCRRFIVGIGIILEETRLEEYIEKSDLVITGEGRLDSQTVMGKAPVGVAAIAKKHGKPVIAFSGCAARDADVCNECGIDAFFPIPQGACSLAKAMDEENTFFNLKATAKQALRLFSLSQK